MDQETAQIVLYVMTGIGLVAWLAALQLVINTFQSRRKPPAESSQTMDWAELPPAHLLVGSLEVEGRPPELASKTAGILAKPGSGPLGLVRITDKQSDRVSFEWSAAYGYPGPYGRTSGGFRRGQIRFSPESMQKSRVDYALEMPAGRGLFFGAVVFLVLGITALVLGFWLIQTRVVDSQDPMLRWQVFQMVQSYHFIWPPFLFAGILRLLRRAIRTGLETMVQNLPHLAN